jgi:hypothetical protein
MCCNSMSARESKVLKSGGARIHVLLDPDCTILQDQLVKCCTGNPTRNRDVIPCVRNATQMHAPAGVSQVSAWAPQEQSGSAARLLEHHSSSAHESCVLQVFRARDGPAFINILLLVQISILWQNADHITLFHFRNYGSTYKRRHTAHTQAMSCCHLISST